MININVNIANHQNKSINLYKPITSNGFLRYNLFSLNKDYEEKTYHGAIFLSSREENILSIKAFELLKFNISLAKHYLIDESGRYSLNLKQDKLFIDHSNQTNTSEVYFNLYVEDNPPVVTYVESSLKLSKSSLKCKNFGNNH